MIALRTVHSQSGNDQWKTLRPVLEEYGIETKIGALVGDNAGSNDVLCCTISSWLSLHYQINWTATHQRIRCQGHVINLIVQAFLFNSKKDRKLIDSYNKEDKKLEEDNKEEQDNEEEVVQQGLKKKGKELKPLLDKKGKRERGKTI